MTTSQIAPALDALRVPTDTLLVHPRNARQGDVGAITQSLTRFGQLKPVVVQASTRHVVAGNHTLKAARALRWPEIAAVLVDLDDAEALAYAIADNRTQELGTYDEDVLAAALTELASAGKLDGTGYDGDDVDALLAKLTGDMHEPGDAEQTDVTQVWGVAIDLDSEQEQVDLLTELAGRGLNVRALMA
jgi:ParB-like chromosome segregation protein Spo0J